MNISIGAMVSICGLRDQRRLNGKSGRVVGIRGARWVVNVDGERLVLKRDNLRTRHGTRVHCDRCRRNVTAYAAEDGGRGGCERCGSREWSRVVRTPVYAPTPPPTAPPADIGGEPASRPEPPAARRRVPQADRPAREGSASSSNSSDDGSERQEAFAVIRVHTDLGVIIMTSSGSDPIFFLNPAALGLPTAAGVLALTELFRAFAEQPSAQPAASKAAVEQLPCETVDAGLLSDTLRDASCSICLEQYAVGHKAVEMPCAHRFHQACLTTWL
eukprot:gene6292-9642_t